MSDKLFRIINYKFGGIHWIAVPWTHKELNKHIDNRKFAYYTSIGVVGFWQKELDKFRKQMERLIKSGSLTLISFSYDDVKLYCILDYDNRLSTLLCNSIDTAFVIWLSGMGYDLTDEEVEILESLDHRDLGCNNCSRIAAGGLGGNPLPVIFAAGKIT